MLEENDRVVGRVPRHGAFSSLWDAWTKTAHENARKIGAIDALTGCALTCSQLTREAERLAKVIGREKEGCVIAFSLPNDMEWLALFLAIQKIGAIALPLDASLAPVARENTARQLKAHFLWQNGLLLELSATQPKLKNVCCIKLTSGSTGNLRPVFCAASHLLADGEQIIRTMKIRPTDRNLAIIPFGHSYGLGNLVLPLILQATPVVCVSSFVPRQIFDSMEQHDVTILPAVPAVFRALAESKFSAPPPSLRLAISAGAPLSAGIAKKFYKCFGVLIHNFYGSSETGGISFDRNGKATLTGRSVGKPLMGVQVTLRKDRRVMVSSRAVVPDHAGRGAGRFVLPDLGEWNDRGELKLVGRKGIAANIGGKKVLPAEVEGHIRKLTGVSDAWVTVMQDKRGDDFLAAAIETVRKLSDIENDLTLNLPAWKMPKRYLIQSSLPRTDRGKLNGSDLKARLAKDI